LLPHQDQSTSNFLNCVKTGTNSFGLNTPFPTLDSFRLTWQELYKPEVTRIEHVRAARIREAEEQKRLAWEASQIETAKAQARLDAAAQVAFNKARQDEWGAVRKAQAVLLTPSSETSSASSSSSSSPQLVETNGSA
jgi:hypothetical protein